jgi:hypothetical protein
MSGEEVLRGLDAVDWGSLAHAFGPASGVPDLLRGLVSDDADARSSAYEEFSNTVWHQGTLYSASPRVAPFLIAMLRSPQTPDHRLPAILLALLADGSSWLQVHATGDSPTDECFRAWLAEEGRDLAAEMAREQRWVEETRLAVGEVVPLLVPFLRDAESGVREVVAYGLARYPQRAEALLPPLRAALCQEAEEHVREAIEGAICALQGAIER